MTSQPLSQVDQLVDVKTLEGVQDHALRREALVLRQRAGNHDAGEAGRYGGLGAQGRILDGKGAAWRDAKPLDSQKIQGGRGFGIDAVVGGADGFEVMEI